MDKKNLIKVIEYLEEQKKNPTFPLMEVHKGYNFAIDLLKDEVINIFFNERKEKNHEKKLDEFEKYYDNEFDDGQYEERLRDEFLEEYELDCGDSTDVIYNTILFHN